MDKILECDICKKAITITAPIHHCKPSFDQMVRLMPGYSEKATDEQAKIIDSFLYGLGHVSLKPEWWDDHRNDVERIIAKYGTRK